MILIPYTLNLKPQTLNPRPQASRISRARQACQAVHNGARSQVFGGSYFLVLHFRGAKWLEHLKLTPMDAPADELAEPCSKLGGAREEGAGEAGAGADSDAVSVASAGSRY